MILQRCSTVNDGTLSSVLEWTALKLPPGSKSYITFDTGVSHECSSSKCFKPCGEDRQQLPTSGHSDCIIRTRDNVGLVNCIQ